MSWVTSYFGLRMPKEGGHMQYMHISAQPSACSSTQSCAVKDNPHPGWGGRNLPYPFNMLIQCICSMCKKKYSAWVEMSHITNIFPVLSSLYRRLYWKIEFIEFNTFCSFSSISAIMATLSARCSSFISFPFILMTGSTACFILYLFEWSSTIF